MSNEATFTINFDENVAGVDAASHSLEGLREKILGGTTALRGMQESLGRLRALSEVKLFESLPREILGAENQVKKLQGQLEKLFKAHAVAPAAKKEGIFAEGQKVSAELEKAKGVLARYRGEFDKLQKLDSVKQFKDQKVAVADLERKLGGWQVAFSKLGGSASDLKAKIEPAFKDIKAGAQAAGGPVGGLVSKLGDLKGLGGAGWATLIAVGIVGIGIAAVAAVAAVTLLVVAVARFAVVSADAARSARLLREAAGGSAAGADAIEASIAKVRANTSATREELQGMALDLRRAGLAGNSLTHALSALTIAEKTLGNEAAGKLRAIIDKDPFKKRFIVNPMDLLGSGIKWQELAAAYGKMTGMSVDAAGAALRNGQVKLSDGVRALDYAVSAKLGNIARKQMLALPAQFARLKENIGGLFSGLDVEPFLGGVKKVLDIFDETTAVGRAMKKLMTSIFQPMLDNATSAMPAIRDRVIDGIIAMSKALRSFVSGAGLSFFFTNAKANAESFLDTVMALAEGLKAIADTIRLIQGKGTLVATKGELAQMNAKISAPSFENEMANNMAAAKVATQQGKQLVAGVAEGVKIGTPEAVKSMQDLADSMLSAFKARNQIQSPSKLFRKESRWIPRGAAEGIEDETPAVDRAVANMADPDAMNSRGNYEAKGSAMQSRGGSVVIQNLVWQGGASEQETRSFVQQLIDEIEAANVAAGRQ